MTAINAQSLAYFAALEADGILAKLCQYTPENPPARFFLHHVRDRLHHYCTFFEDGDACDDFEQWYLPLFDSLSLVTEATYLSEDWHLKLQTAHGFIVKLKADAKLS